MKVNEVVYNVKTEGLEDSIEWTVSESSFLFDLLGTKLYKNPQKAVCREYFTNAQDANIESGSKKPIEIHLPSTAIPYLVVKDSGIGIGPERAKELYTKLGESSKRDANKQVGALGIGRVSCFSMTDQFTIETVFENRKYIYLVFKNQRGIPELTSDNYAGEPTTDPSGTKITIPIKTKDIEDIKREGLNLLRWFPTKPIVNLTVPTYNPIFETSNYTLDKGANTYNVSKIYAVMGSIAYPVEGYSITNGYDLYLHFKIGEISIEASREGLHYDEKTKKKLSAALDSFKLDIKEKLSKEFEGLADWALYCKKNEVTERFNGLVDFKHTIKLSKECGHTFRMGYQGKRLEESYETTVKPESDIQLFIMDKPSKFVKPLYEWSQARNKSPLIISSEKDKIDEVKKCLGVTDKDFLFTSMFKSTTKRTSYSVRGITLIRTDKYEARNAFEALSDVELEELEVKYYVIRKGLKILWKTGEYYVHRISDYVDCGSKDNYLTFNGEKVYALLPSQVKDWPDALHIFDEQQKNLEADLKTEDLQAIVKAQQLNHPGFSWEWNLPLIKEAEKEVKEVRRNASIANLKMAKLNKLGIFKPLPELKHKFKYEVIKETDSILRYLIVPDNQKHRTMIEEILTKQLSNVKF